MNLMGCPKGNDFPAVIFYGSCDLDRWQNGRGWFDEFTVNTVGFRMNGVIKSVSFPYSVVEETFMVENPDLVQNSENQNSL